MIGAAQQNAQQPSQPKPAATQRPRSPAAQARPAAALVSADSARLLALARFPGATVVRHSVKQEHDTTMYQFTIRERGRGARHMVEVNAMSGALTVKEPTAVAQHRPTNR